MQISQWNVVTSLVMNILESYLDLLHISLIKDRELRNKNQEKFEWWFEMGNTKIQDD